MSPTAAARRTAAAARAGAPRKWAGGKWIRPARRLAIYLRDGFICGYCGANLASAKGTAGGGSAATLDHFTPYVRGGSNATGNLFTACRPCNSARGARAVSAYATPGAVAAINRNRRRSLTPYLAAAKALLAGAGTALS